MTSVTRGLGVALMMLIAVHMTVRPEHAWLLVSTCDIAAIVTAVGLVASRPRWIAVACLFQGAVGLPALVIGMLTTYDTNITGVAIHVVPLAIGATVVARDGLPPRAALVAWLGYAASMLLASVIGPPELNLNFGSRVWPPVAHVFPALILFQCAVISLVGGLLAAGSWLVRRRSPATTSS
jgi:hypothetical protein